MQIEINPAKSAKQAWYSVRLAIVYSAVFALCITTIPQALTLSFVTLAINLWLIDMGLAHAAKLEREVLEDRLAVELPLVGPIRSFVRAVNWREKFGGGVTIEINKPKPNGKAPASKSKLPKEYAQFEG